MIICGRCGGKFIGSSKKKKGMVTCEKCGRKFDYELAVKATERMKENEIELSKDLEKIRKDRIEKAKAMHLPYIQYAEISRDDKYVYIVIEDVSPKIEIGSGEIGSTGNSEFISLENPNYNSVCYRKDNKLSEYWTNELYIWGTDKTRNHDTIKVEIDKWDSLKRDLENFNKQYLETKTSRERVLVSIIDEISNNLQQLKRIITDVGI